MTGRSTRMLLLLLALVVSPGAGCETSGRITPPPAGQVRIVRGDLPGGLPLIDAHSFSVPRRRKAEIDRMAKDYALRVGGNVAHVRVLDEVSDRMMVNVTVFRAR